MLDEAKRYCRTVANGLPRNFEFDDLVQEYVAAELEGKSGPKAVQNYVAEIDKQNKNLVSYHSMGFVVADEIDLDANESERDEYQQIENEITDEIKDSRRKRLVELNQKLDRIHPDRAEVIRFLSTCDIDDEHGTVSSIMERFGCDFASARYMWYDGIESIRELDNPSKKKEMPMYGEADYVPDLRTPHKKWKRTRKQPESEVILGEEAA